MAIVKSKTFLETLIQTGPDASLNLFSVNFKPHGETEYQRKLSCRVTTFPTPKMDSTTVDIPYQNIKIQKPAPGTDISKTISFEVRVDQNYELLSYLRSKQCIDSIGAYNLDEDNSFEITVDALKPYSGLMSNEQYTSIYRWKFYDSYIMSVGSMSFGYENANAASVVVTFVYKYFDESPYKNEEVSQAKDAWETLKDKFRNNKNKN